MATNLNAYMPNVGEIEALKAILLTNGLEIGLYKVAIIPDGNTILSTLSEWGVDGTYARKVLTNELVEDALAANKWYRYTNALGKAEGAYSNAVLSWSFNATDVAKGATVFGVFAITRVLAFTSGLQPIKVGDVIYQGAVCAEVTGVEVTSGSWAAGTAAGNLTIKRQNGVFVAGATLKDASKGTATAEIKGLTAAPIVGGTGYAVGDRFLIGTGTGGVGRVAAVTTGGVVAAVELLSGGQDYTVATQATTKIDGGGDNALTVAVATLYTAGPAVSIATLAGDSTQKLMAIWPHTTGVAITLEGQIVTFDLKMALATGT